jgi:hypothetical protein
MFGEFGIGWRPSSVFELHLDVGPGVVLATPSFENLGDRSPVFQSSAVVGRAMLAAEIYL